jgi:hypothetical protein
MLFLFNFFKRKVPTETDILNYGLKLAMEFGKNWMKPIQDRLAKQYPFLNQDELNNYNKICREAMDFGHSLIYDKLSSIADMGETIVEEELFTYLKKGITQEYPWLNKRNLNGLYNQSLYYAWKDGLTDIIKQSHTNK